MTAAEPGDGPAAALWQYYHLGMLPSGSKIPFPLEHPTLVVLSVVDADWICMEEE